MNYVVHVPFQNWICKTWKSFPIIVDQKELNKMPLENVARCVALSVMGMSSYTKGDIGIAARETGERERVLIELLKMSPEYWQRFLSFETPSVYTTPIAPPSSRTVWESPAAVDRSMLGPVTVSPQEKIFETYKVASGAEYHFQTKAIVEFIEFEMRKVIRYFEQKTLNLLNEIFRQDAKLARSSLEIDYEIIFRDDVNSSSKLRYQSQPSNAVTWGGCLQAKTAMCYIFPCLIYVEDNSRRRRGPVSGPEQSIRNETSKIISINTAESLQQNETGDSSYLAHPTNEVNISDDLLDESYSRANNLIDESDNIPGTSVIYSNEDEQGKQRMRNKNIAPVGKMEALGVIFPIRHSKVEKESYELESIASNEKEPLKGEDLLEKEDLHKGSGYETKKKRTWRRLLSRMFGHYKTTGAKFIIHLLLRAIYVCLYAWVLVAKPRRTYSIPYPAAYWAEILVASVQMTQLCEFVIKVKHQMAPPDLRNEPSISTIQRRYKGMIKRLNRSFQDWAREHRVSLWRNGVIIANAILAIGIIVHASLHDGEI
uniref:Piezo_RRas_bdg domain-containing protein n=1 Tax=Heterorhabditis bacteriophora TaxID=37862 RepID=A0A1I7XCZ4_HETBA